MHAQLASPYDIRPALADSLEDPSRWPEGDWLTRRFGDYELILSREGVTHRQINDIRRGEAEFALAVEGPLVLLCYRFGNAFPWAHVPYSVRHMPTGDRVSYHGEATPTSRAVLSVLLIEADGVQTRASRVVTLSMDFTLALDESIRAQGRRLMAPGTQERAAERLVQERRPTANFVQDAVCTSFGSP